MCTRIMATMGGHVGSLVRKVVVRDTGEDVMVAYHRNLEVTVEAIRGTARMSQYDALQHLVAHGAQLLAHTTPPLVAMHDEARGLRLAGTRLARDEHRHASLPVQPRARRLGDGVRVRLGLAHLARPVAVKGHHRSAALDGRGPATLTS